MRNLITLSITLLIACFFISCEDSNSESGLYSINYPSKTEYGFNILNDSINTITIYNPSKPDIVSPDYSITAILDQKSELKVILTAIDNGCHIYSGFGCTYWWIWNQYPMEPENWDATEYTDKGIDQCEVPSGHTQTFTAISGSTCNLRINFAPVRGSSCQVTVDIYENGSETPTRSKKMDLEF